MPGDLLSPRLAASYQNDLLEHGKKAFKETLRLIYTNYIQEGYMPYTVPLTGAEKQAWLLTPEATQQAFQYMQDPDTNRASQGVELMKEIEEAQNRSILGTQYGQQTTA